VFSFSNGLVLPVAAIGADERMTLMQDVGYQAVGVLIVIGALSFIAIVLTLMGKAFVNSEARATTSKAAVASALAAESPTLPVENKASGEPDAELRAAIVAAVYYTVGSHARVLDIQSAHPELAAWSMEGRRQIFLSHRVR
jgi:Na+-transporting methylmalonyl-CoA/oxaloacetate decarboxylase gamma subunit